MATKITNPDDLKAVRDRARAEIDLRTGPKDTQIMVHMGTCGIAAGARDVLAALYDALVKASVNTVTLRQSGCAGLCDREPMFTLTDKSGRQFRYGRLDANKVQRIVQEHVVSGNPVNEYLITS
jgi:NADP-reducing hydrogenase subunit HndB